MVKKGAFRILLDLRRRARIIVTRTKQYIKAEIAANVIQHHSQMGISAIDIEGLP